MAFTAILCSLTLARLIGNLAQVLTTLSFSYMCLKGLQKETSGLVGSVGKEIVYCVTYALAK